MMYSVLMHKIDCMYSILPYTAALIMSFADIDECNPSSGIVHGCQMRCKNVPGGYTCYCDKGFTLKANRRDCSGNS